VAISKAFLEGGQTGLDAAVIDIAADFDSETADEGGVLRERDIQTASVEVHEAGLDAGLQLGRQGDGALNFGRAAFDIEFQKALEMRQDGEIAARLGVKDALDNLPGTVFIQQPVHNANTEEFFGFAPGWV
jgi:hypothetical protein